MSAERLEPAPGVRVRLAEDSDEPRVLELLNEAFGTWPREMHGVGARDFYRWKHFQSPFGRSIRLVAEAERELIGCFALMPWRLRAGGHVLETVRGTDLAVAPAHRRRGVSMSLLEVGRTHYPAAVALGWSNPNALSRGGVLQAVGRRKVDGLPRYVRVGAGPLGVLARAASGRVRALATDTRVGASAAELLGDGTAIAALLASAAPSERLQTDRSLDFLRWRYGALESYRALAASARDGAPPGLTIYRLRRHGRFSVAQVCELFLARDDRGLARALLRGVAATTGADLLACTFASRVEAARRGFFLSPRGAMISAYPMRPNIAPDPALAASWALSLGDLELL